MFQGAAGTFSSDFSISFGGDPRAAVRHEAGLLVIRPSARPGDGQNVSWACTRICLPGWYAMGLAAVTSLKSASVITPFSFVTSSRVLADPAWHVNRTARNPAAKASRFMASPFAGSFGAG